MSKMTNREHGVTEVGTADVTPAHGRSATDQSNNYRSQSQPSSSPNVSIVYTSIISAKGCQCRSRHLSLHAARREWTMGCACSKEETCKNSLKTTGAKGNYAPPKGVCVRTLRCETTIAGDSGDGGKREIGPQSVRLNRAPKAGKSTAPSTMPSSLKSNGETRPVIEAVAEGGEVDGTVDDAVGVEVAEEPAEVRGSGSCRR